MSNASVGLKDDRPQGKMFIDTSSLSDLGVGQAANSKTARES